MEQYNDYKKNVMILITILILAFIIGIKSTVLGIIIIFISIAVFIYLEFAKKSKKIKKIITAKNPKKIFDLESTLPFPFLILDGNKIVYTSASFVKRFKVDIKTLGYITKMIPEFEVGVYRQKVNYSGSDFLLYLSHINYLNKSDSEIIYFVENLYGLDKGVAGYESVIASLIYVDNYEEVRAEVDESRRPLLVALIDRKINSMSAQVGGIVRKFEKDKYLFLLYNDKLNYLKERKFDILDKVREIDVGNKMPVTLSIGMGISERSLAKSMGYARQAMDLALGRGGDQVLIKDSQKFYFYGGSSKEVGTNTRVRARVKAYALGELIDEAHDVIIMGHKNPDLDCIGASVAIHAIVRAYGKTSKIVLNEVTTSINILQERLVKEGNYKDVFITSKSAMDIITPNTLLVIVDTNRPSLVEELQLLEKSKKTVLFDHHRKSTEFIENTALTYHEPYASSTCELVTEMMSYVRNEVDLLQVEADAILAGITVDTKNFAFKTGAKTFEAAALLKRKGADSIRVRLLFQYKMDTYKAKAVTVNNAEIFNDTIAISFCPKDTENPSLIAAQAADDLLNICGIEASFVFCSEHDKIIISGRSLGNVNVQLIMEKLGGGGHQLVAGAQLSNCSMDDAVVQLKQAIKKYNLEGTK